MLVHICCAVDSHYFLQKLQEAYPNEKLIGFFYDPNIHPYSEYRLRLLDVERSCKMLDIPLIEGAYDVDRWMQTVKGFEKEPEKGKRCAICFDRRFEVSAQKASQLGEKYYTSTLLTSPKKSLKQLALAGEALGKRYGVTFLSPDFRKASGTQEQNILAKKDALYRQDYCGCLFGLTIQREEQQRLADELFTPLSEQIQPESIEARLALYEERLILEEKGVEYRITKERFLNWRVTFALLKEKNRVVTSHILPYSVIKGEFTRGRVEYEVEGVFYMNRDEVKFISLDFYNQLLNANYTSVKMLLFSPPPFEEEVTLRQKMGLKPYDISTVIVVDEIPKGKITLQLKSHIYEDVQEVLRRVS